MSALYEKHSPICLNVADVFGRRAEEEEYIHCLSLSFSDKKIRHGFKNLCVL